MVSAYYKQKIKTEDFKNNIEKIFENFKDKKVLIYGDNKNFAKLNKIYGFTKKLDIAAIVDEKLKRGKTSVFCGIKSISKSDILNDRFDVILVTNEDSKQTISELAAEYSFDKDIISPLFVETILDESKNLNILYKNKFDKTYPKLVRKMKNKKVVLYGAGIFLETIMKYFDLSKLNIIGIADKKYSIVNNEETFFGYKTYNPAEIKDLKPDYVLMSTKFYVGIFEYLHFNLLQGMNIKVKPLMQKSFLTLLKEVIES